MKPLPCKVVLALEDDENDRFFIERAFKDNNFDGKLIMLENGQDGIDYVSGTGPYADRQRYPLPDIVLTDLKMPRVSGMEFLRWMKQHTDFRSIPVIVLSASGQERDVQEAYCHGANAYLVKPSAPPERRELIGQLLAFWSSSQRPPTVKC